MKRLSAAARRLAAPLRRLRLEAYLLCLAVALLACGTVFFLAAFSWAAIAVAGVCIVWGGALVVVVWMER